MKEDIADTVAAAFAAVRTGTYEKVSRLADAGPGILPHLKPYVTDGDEMVRTQAVALLATFTEPQAVPLLAAALTDDQQDIRARAASALYANYDPLELAKEPTLEKALGISLNKGNDAAAAILLAGYFPVEDMGKALRDLDARSLDADTELTSWSPPVPVKLAAAISLSRFGEQAARMHLMETAASGTPAEREFLLSVMREIDAPEVLHALAATLDDTTAISSGVPSGAAPQRRLCDLAVEQFVQRLNLTVDFNQNSHSRYTSEEINQVRTAIREQLPRG